MKGRPKKEAGNIGMTVAGPDGITGMQKAKGIMRYSDTIAAGPVTASKKALARRKLNKRERDFLNLVKGAKDLKGSEPDLEDLEKLRKEKIKKSKKKASKAALKKRGFSEGGSVSQRMRGTGAAIRGTKFKGVF